MNPHDLFGSDYNAFCEVDPFNPQNKVEGYISRKPNEYYGALIITRINDKGVPEQLICGSPKIHYPFDSLQDGTRRYKFPVVRDVEIYIKLDGSNVISYLYTDGEQEFMTHKLRLRPFMANSRFGNFLDMWKEIATRYFETIREVMKSWHCNLSWEIFGARNTHLIVYENALDIALLFGVTNTGRILSPTDLGLARRDDYSPSGLLPLVSRFDVIDRDYARHYERIQNELETKLHKIEGEEHYTGIEGTVWYAHFPDSRCSQFKNKPASVEAIHFATGGLSKNTIIATCWNAYENVDVLTIEFVKQLLLEEYDAVKIEANTKLIQKCIALVTSEMEFRQEVLEAYKKVGLNVLLNKREVMRTLSAYFERSRMGKVYSIVVNYSG